MGNFFHETGNKMGQDGKNISNTGQFGKLLRNIRNCDSKYIIEA